MNRKPGSWSTFMRTWPRTQRSRKTPQRNGRFVSRFENLKHPGYLNESVADQQQPVSTLVRPSPAFSKTINGIITSPPSRSSLINAPWSYAVRVLIYWCCTNRICIYKDQLKDFCSRVVNSHIYALHVSKHLQNYAEETSNEVDHEYAELPESFAIKPSPITKDTTKR